MSRLPLPVASKPPLVAQSASLGVGTMLLRRC